MRTPRTALVIAVSSAAMLLSVVPAAAGNTSGPSASGVSIGQTTFGGPCADPNLLLMQAATVRPPSYTVPSGGGVVTSWSYQSGGVVGHVQLVVAIPTGPVGWTLVARSAKETPPAKALDTFATRLPVPAGATLGLWADNVGMECAGAGTDGDLVLATHVDPDSTSVVNTPISLPRVRLDVSAVVEPDTDGDGYGDLTQDRCPQLATVQVACPVPDTTILNKPPRHLFTRRARISFTSAPGATFTCAVDGRTARPCRSPFRRRYFVGRHRVLITATDQLGIVETTPARVAFRVLPRSES